MFEEESYDKNSAHKRVGVYLRVSTEDQTLESQRNAIKEYIAVRQEEFPEVRWYEDLGYSGGNTKRPAFLQLLKDVGCRRIRTVIVYKLDRLARISATAIQTILRFDEMKCDFISITQPHFNTPAFRLSMISIFADLGQMERDQTIERIHAGIAAAKAKGVKFGRKTVMTPEMTKRALELRQKKVTFSAISKELKVSVGAIHKSIKYTPNPVKHRKLMATPCVGVSVSMGRADTIKQHGAGYTSHRSQNRGHYLVCKCCRAVGPVRFTHSAAKDAMLDMLMEQSRKQLRVR